MRAKIVLSFAFSLFFITRTCNQENQPTNKSIAWGILSTAKINSAFIDGIRQSDRSVLAAVASRDLQKAQNYATSNQIPKAYGTYEELLADPEIDAVYISLPNALHAPWIIKAIKACKHVMCEKPLVLTLEDLDTIQNEAAAHNVTVFEALMYLHHPQMDRVKELIQEGSIGKIQHINSWLGVSLPLNTDNYRLNPDLGGGCLWDLGVYCTSLAIVLAQGELPLEVYATSQQGKTGVDMITNGMITFENGVTAQMAMSYDSGFREGAHIVGTEGTIMLVEPWKRRTQSGPGIIQVSDKYGIRREIPVPAKHSFLCEIQAMEAFILDDVQPVVPLGLSKVILKTILGLYQSAFEGRAIKIVDRSIDKKKRPSRLSLEEPH